MKTHITALVIILAAINFSFAEKNPADSAGTLKKYKQYSKFEIFFQPGYALPVGTFGKTNLSDPGDDTKAFLQKSIEGDSGGFNAQSAMNFECGMILFIHRHPLKTMFGIRTILFSYASFPFRWQSDSDLVFNDAKFNSVRLISMRTGPIMRVYSKNNLQFDFFYQIGVAFSSHGGWNYSNQHDEFYNGFKFNVNDNADFKMNGGFGIMHEIGTALSFHCLKAGVSFNFASLKYNNVEFYRNIGISSGYSQYALYSDDKLAVKAPTSYLKFFIGLRLGD